MIDFLALTLMVISLSTIFYLDLPNVAYPFWSKFVPTCFFVSAVVIATRAVLKMFGIL